MAIHYVEQSLHKLQKLYHQKAYHEVIDEAKKLLKSSAIKQNRNQQFHCLLLLGESYSFQAKFAEMVQIVAQLQPIFPWIKNVEQSRRYYMLMMHCWSFFKQHAKAIYYFEKAISLQKSELSSYTNQVYYTLAALHMLNGQFEQSLKEVQIIQQRQNKQKRGYFLIEYVYFLEARLRLELGQILEARLLFNSLNKFVITQHSQVMKNDYFLLQLRLYLAEKAHKKAIQLALEMITFEQTENDPLIREYVYPLVIEHYLQYEDYEKVVELQRQVIQSYQHNNLLQQMNDMEILQQKYELREQMNVDDLTGAYMRSFMMDVFQEMFAENEWYQLYMFDLDDFKLINDRYGHLVGDQALIQTVEATKQYFEQQAAIITRFGGDEFIVIVKNDYAIETNAQAFWEHMAKQTINEGRIHLRYSIGAVLIANRQPLDVAIELADQLLYTVKETGKGYLKYKIID